MSVKVVILVFNFLLGILACSHGNAVGSVPGPTGIVPGTNFDIVTHSPTSAQPAVTSSSVSIPVTSYPLIAAHLVSGSSQTSGGPVCGNGLLELGESCDDGPLNGLNGLCSADCCGAKNFTLETDNSTSLSLIHGELYTGVVANIVQTSGEVLRVPVLHQCVEVGSIQNNSITLGGAALLLGGTNLSETSDIPNNIGEIDKQYLQAHLLARTLPCTNGTTSAVVEKLLIYLGEKLIDAVISGLGKLWDAIFGSDEGTTITISKIEVPCCEFSRVQDKKGNISIKKRHVKKTFTLQCLPKKKDGFNPKNKEELVKAVNLCVNEALKILNSGELCRNPNNVINKTIRLKLCSSL